MESQFKLELQRAQDEGLVSVEFNYTAELVDRRPCHFAGVGNRSLAAIARGWSRSVGTGK